MLAAIFKVGLKNCKQYNIDHHDFKLNLMSPNNLNCIHIIAGLSVCLSVCQSVCLSIFLLSVCQSVCLSLIIAFHGVLLHVKYFKYYAFLQTVKIWLEDYCTFLQPCLHIFRLMELGNTVTRNVYPPSLSLTLTLRN